MNLITFQMNTESWSEKWKAERKARSLLKFALNDSKFETTLVVSFENTVLTWTWEGCGQFRRDFLGGGRKRLKQRKNRGL